MNAPAAALKPAPRKPRPDEEAELNNLAMSKEAQPLFDAVKTHIEENVAPITEEFFTPRRGPRGALVAGRRASSSCCETAKDKAKKARPVELLPARRRDRPRA